MVQMKFVPLMKLLLDGSLLSKAQYFKSGEAAGGREVLYKEDRHAEVKFK